MNFYIATYNSFIPQVFLYQRHFGYKTTYLYFLYAPLNKKKMCKAMYSDEIY